MAQQVENGGGRSGWKMAAWTAVIGVILLLPLVAMQFTNEVAWTASDFVAAGTILGAAALTYELGARKSAKRAYRAGVGIAVATAFLIVWSCGAVGIIGSEQNDANFMFAGVLLVGLLGAVLARFQPGGMARAMVAAALAQAAAGAIALGAGWGAGDPSYPWDIIGATGVFTAMWLASAWLFHATAHT